MTTVGGTNKEYPTASQEQFRTVRPGDECAWRNPLYIGRSRIGSFTVNSNILKNSAIALIINFGLSDNKDIYVMHFEAIQTTVCLYKY